MSTRQLPICGIPCTVRSPAIRRAIRRVLEQIRPRAPKDFARIVSLVREFVPIPPSNDGTQGQWKAGPIIEEFNVQGVVMVHEAPGVVELVEDLTNPVATVAHELGHVCTREEDRAKRLGVPIDGWAIELTADYYAYKWGFGRDLAKARKNLDWTHHGPRRGEEVSFEFAGRVHRYRVTRNFYLRFVREEKRRTPEPKRSRERHSLPPRQSERAP